jgi:hypothetical protein
MSLAFLPRNSPGTCFQNCRVKARGCLDAVWSFIFARRSARNATVGPPT